ncbi:MULTISPECIES: hypothetical protein [unclassified Okeania]|nr:MULTISPECIES: hypothetical protein [unclassified Okeania]
MNALSSGHDIIPQITNAPISYRSHLISLQAVRVFGTGVRSQNSGVREIE